MAFTPEFQTVILWFELPVKNTANISPIGCNIFLEGGQFSNQSLIFMWLD